MMIFKEKILFCLCFLLTACDLFDYHPYDTKTEGYHHINDVAISQIETSCADKDTIRFVWMGDTQRWYDETERFVNSVNQRDSIDFVIHGGDISDFGMTKEFDWVHRIMKKLHVPYVALIGNHDIIGNGMAVFLSMYGKENFSIVAGDTRIVCLNTNALEFDYSHPVPDFNFISQLISDQDSRVKRTIVAMHTPPFNEQFNNNVAEVFQHYIKHLPELQFCLHAHIHKQMIRDLFCDNILYYGCDSMKDRTYYLFTLTPDRIFYEIVSF